MCGEFVVECVVVVVFCAAYSARQKHASFFDFIFGLSRFGKFTFSFPYLGSQKKAYPRG
jgi:hypothetical protein